jgi:sphingosine kinase
MPDCLSSIADRGIDGEAFDFTSFHVEVVPQVAHIVSMDGKFFVSDFIKKHDIKDGSGKG